MYLFSYIKFGINTGVVWVRKKVLISSNPRNIVPLPMNKPIGIIDSGVGGLSIASVLIKKLPKESFIYIADSQNCPYGQKDKEEIYELTKKMIDYLLKRNIKLLVIACNTITVTSIDRLRKEFKQIPIVGIVPVIKTAQEKTLNKRIGVYSTMVTANSSYQKKLIDKFAKESRVISLGSSKLFSLIEKGDKKGINRLLNKELKIFIENNIDTLALGCSHFPLIKKQIGKLLPGVLVLDSSTAVFNQVERILKNNNALSSSLNSDYNFLTTGDEEIFAEFVKGVIGEKLTNKAKLSRISLHD